MVVMTEVRLVVDGPTNAVQVVDMHKSVAAAARVVACERCFAVIVVIEYQWLLCRRST